MQQNLDAGLVTRCYYDVQGKRVLFTVRGEPEYGVLDLDAFAHEDAP
jgi:hypothetical protein